MDYPVGFLTYPSSERLPTLLSAVTYCSDSQEITAAGTVADSHSVPS